MKIAFVNDTFLEGRGADTVIYELARRLGKNKKNKIYVICGESNFKEDNFKIVKVKLGKLFTGKINDFNYFSKLRKLQKQILELKKEYGFDIFNVHHLGLNSAFRGLPTIVTWHGSPSTKNPLRKIISKTWIKTLNNNEKTIVISNFLASQLKNIENKIEIIPDGVSSEFRPAGKDKEYMLYVGRLEKHKNIQELIRLSRDINFKLKIVGYGPEDKKLRILAKKSNALVSFLGKISRKELIRLYQGCSFFVSASKWEGFGLIFIEAGACGKPSIGYRVGSIPEVIIDKKTGFLVDNYPEFQKKAKLLKENKNLRKKLGKSALNFSKKFNWNNISREYGLVFKKVVKK